MQKQKHCYSPLPVFVTWTQGILKGTSPPERKKKTPVERISLPTPPLLTRLIKNSSFPLSRLPPPTQRRTKTTSTEVLNAEEAVEDRIMAMIFLQWMSMPLSSRRRRETSPKSSATTVTKRNIRLPSVPKSQKTSVSLGDLHAGDLD